MRKRKRGVALCGGCTRKYGRKEKNMDNPKDKQKFALWTYPETMKRVETLYRDDGCKSKSEFIEKAINFYCGYLTAENYREYFPSVILPL
mgnify:CR=1 FL=1